MNVPIDPIATRVLTEFKHNSPLIGCRFDPTGRYLFASAQDNSVLRFDLFDGRKVAFTGHQSWLRGMAFVAPRRKEAEAIVAFEKSRATAQGILGGRATGMREKPFPPFTVISGDYHGRLTWWSGEVDEPKLIRTIDAHSGWIRAVAVSPDEQTVATCGNDQVIRLWSANDGKHLKTLEGHASHVYNIAFHPDGLHLVSGDLKGIVKIWDLKKGEAIRELDAKALYKYDNTFMADIGGIRGIAISKDGSQVACAGITNVSNAFAGVGNPLILLYDWKDGKAKQLKPKEAFQGTAWGVEFQSDGYVIGAGGGGQGRIWFWKPADASNVHSVNVPANARDMALHPDGTSVAVACFDGSARIYTMLPGPPVAKKEPEPPKKK
jgi:WD40 repeat protein